MMTNSPPFSLVQLIAKHKIITTGLADMSRHSDSSVSNQAGPADLQ